MAALAVAFRDLVAKTCENLVKTLRESAKHTMPLPLNGQADIWQIIVGSSKQNPI